MRPPLGAGWTPSGQRAHHDLRVQGLYTAAPELHQRAIAAARPTNDPTALTRARNDLGEIRYVQDQYDLAVEIHTQALAGARAVGDRTGKVDALNGVGNA